MDPTVTCCEVKRKTEARTGGIAVEQLGPRDAVVFRDCCRHRIRPHEESIPRRAVSGALPLLCLLLRLEAAAGALPSCCILLALCIVTDTQLKSQLTVMSWLQYKVHVQLANGASPFIWSETSRTTHLLALVRSARNHWAALSGHVMTGKCVASRTQMVHSEKSQWP